MLRRSVKLVLQGNTGEPLSHSKPHTKQGEFWSCFMEICGPISPATPSGNRYFLLLVDDYNRYIWISLLPAKDGAASAIKRVQAAAERKTGNLLGGLRTECGGEFSAVDFNKYCAQLGVNRERSAPYTPQQNGVVERRNQSVMATARCMLNTKQLLGIFFGRL
jgi:transposase InsO family protein